MESLLGLLDRKQKLSNNYVPGDFSKSLSLLKRQMFFAVFIQMFSILFLYLFSAWLSPIWEYSRKNVQVDENILSYFSELEVNYFDLWESKNSHVLFCSQSRYRSTIESSESKMPFALLVDALSQAYLLLRPFILRGHKESWALPIMEVLWHSRRSIGHGTWIRRHHSFRKKYANLDRFSFQMRKFSSLSRWVCLWRFLSIHLSLSL